MDTPLEDVVKDLREGEELAVIYGPVGFIRQQPGQKPVVSIRQQWQEVGTTCNRTIANGEAIIGSDRVARVITENVTKEDLATLDLFLSTISHGDLHIVPSRQDLL